MSFYAIHLIFHRSIPNRPVAAEDMTLSARIYDPAMTVLRIALIPYRIRRVCARSPYCHYLCLVCKLPPYLYRSARVGIRTTIYYYVLILYLTM